MSLDFEWDADKAKRNIKKHAVSFEEASTVFRDPLAPTIHDPQHSQDEDRYVILGESARSRLLVVSRTVTIEFASSALVSQRARSGETMKKGTSKKKDMLEEYDFSQGERGKYAERYAAGTNVVVLAPDVAAAFPTTESVNEALRALIKIAQRNGTAQQKKS